MKAKAIFVIVSNHQEITSPGLYKVIDSDGIYWGRYYAGNNWCGEFFVAHCDYKGIPY